MEDLRDLPYMFSNIAAIALKIPVFPQRVKPRIQWILIWMSVYAWKFYFDSKQKITSSANIGKNMKIYFSVWKVLFKSTHFLQIWWPCLEDESRFYGGDHHPTPVDMANKRLKNPIQSMIGVLIIASGLTEFLSIYRLNHIMERPQNTGVVYQNFTHQNTGVLLGWFITRSTQLCLWGCSAQHLHQSLDTFPVTSSASLGDLWISEKKNGVFEVIPKDHSPLATCNIPPNGKCCCNALGESEAIFRKENHWKDSWGENYGNDMHNIHYTYIYSSPNLKKVCPIWSRVRLQLIESTTFAHPKQDKFGDSGNQREIETLQILLVSIRLRIDMQPSLKIASWIWHPLVSGDRQFLVCAKTEPSETQKSGGSAICSMYQTHCK